MVTPASKIICPKYSILFLEKHILFAFQIVDFVAKCPTPITNAPIVSFNKKNQNSFLRKWLDYSLNFEKLDRALVKAKGITRN